MRITIKVKDVELTFEGSDTADYPRIVTKDKYKGDMNNDVESWTTCWPGMVVSPSIY